jgi:long-chain fatty acid transport protein
VKRRVRVMGYLLGTLGCFAAWPAAGQSDNPANAGIQFDFSLPGARSLALGGAFVGIADDATAAWTNPAGLVALTRPEVSIEARGWEFANPFAEGGHAFGQATGVGFDTITGVTEGSASTWTGAPSFISFVYPLSRLTVAGYRHQLQKFEASLASNGIFIRTTSPTPIFPDGQHVRSCVGD